MKQIKKKINFKIIISLIILVIIFTLIVVFYNRHKNQMAEIESKKPYNLENVRVKEDFGFSEKIKNYSRVLNDAFLYKKPDVSSNTTVEVKKGMYLKTYGEEENFSKINYDNSIYYIKTKDLENVSKEDSFKVLNGILIVNSKYSIPSDFSPGVNKFMIEQFNVMATDAKRENVSIKIISDFISYEQQKELYSKSKEVKEGEYIDSHTTKQGYSESQIGESIDIGIEDEKYNYSLDFSNTDEYKWLEKNAHKYGFILRYPKEKESITNYSFAPWHFRFVGVEIAKEINEKKLTLEEFLKK